MDRVTSEQQSGLKLWSLTAEIQEKTDSLRDVRSRLNAQFQKNHAESHNKNVCSEYWQQVDHKVQEQMKQDGISKTHDQYWDRHYDNQVGQHIKIMDSAPTLTHQKIQALGSKTGKGVATQAQKRNIEMQDPFYPITNPQAAQNLYSQKTMTYIAQKFDHEINQIADTMVQSVKKTKLGREVLQKHNKLSNNQISGQLRGDIAIVSLNQNLVELEQLQNLNSKVEGTEADFNSYQDDILRHVSQKKHQNDNPQTTQNNNQAVTKQPRSSTLRSGPDFRIPSRRIHKNEEWLQASRLCKLPLKNAKQRYMQQIRRIGDAQNNPTQEVGVDAEFMVGPEGLEQIIDSQVPMHFKSQQAWGPSSDDKSEDIVSVKSGLGHTQKLLQYQELPVTIQVVDEMALMHEDTFLELKMEKQVMTSAQAQNIDNKNSWRHYMNEYLRCSTQQDNMNDLGASLSQSDLQKVWQIKQIQDQVFKKKNTKEANANRRQFTWTYVKPSSKQQLLQTNGNVNANQKAGVSASGTHNSVTKDRLNYSDYQMKPSDLDERNESSYRVKQEIQFEYMETEKQMNKMCQIMEGSGNKAQDDANEQFMMSDQDDTPNRTKQRGDKQLENNQRNMTIKTENHMTDGSDFIEESQISQSEDQTKDWSKKHSSLTLDGNKQQSIMRKSAFIERPLNMGEGDIEKFYEENLDREDFDSDMIKRLFFDKKVRFTQEMRMKRYFNSDFNTKQTTTMQDNSMTNTESGITLSDDLLKNIGGSFTESEGEWDNNIIPLRNQYNRRKHATIPMLQNNQIMQTQAVKGAKADQEEGKSQWRQNLEYFEKIKKIVPEKRNLLDNVGKVTSKMKKMALLGGSNVKVRADEDRSDEFGQQNFFGNVTKRRAETSKFHARWMVLRGLDLYWYRRVDDDGQKGVMQVPGKPIVEEWVDNTKCFCLQKDDEVPGSRRLVFSSEADEVMKEFRIQCTIMTNFKMYIDQLCKCRDRIDPNITNYMKMVTDSKILCLKDTSLNADYRMDPILSKLHGHENLQRLTLSNCGIGDEYFTRVLDVLEKQKVMIVHLDVSQNELSMHSMVPLSNYLANYLCSKSLESIVLDKNDLHDDGIREVVDGMWERFSNIDKQSYPNALSFGKLSAKAQTGTISMPLSHLSLSNTGMHEPGFKYLVHQLGKMHQKAVQTNREYVQSMHLDVSRNLLTDEAVKSLADLITKFEGIRSLNMMAIRPHMGKKDTGYADLAKALKENKSIEQLDLRDNHILESSLQKLIESLEYNFVLSEIKVDLKTKKLPTKFSSYALQSMFEFSMSKEDIQISTMQTTDMD